MTLAFLPRASTDDPLTQPDPGADAGGARLEEYRLGVEASPTGVLMIDEHGTITLVNRQIERWFGHPRAELLGRSVETLVPDRFRAGHRARREGFLRGPTARAMGDGTTLYGVRRDGSEFPIEIGLNPIDTDRGKRVLATIVDVTERKRQEAELRAQLLQLQRYQREMALLGEMSSLLQLAGTESEAMEIVRSFGARLLPGSTVAIYRLGDGQAVELQAHWGDGRVRDSFPADACWALRRAQVHHTSPDAAPRCRHAAEDEEPVWQTCIPMTVHGQDGGVVVVTSARPASGAEREDVERVGKAVADQLGLAVANLRLRDSLRALAIRDPLTHMFNRRYLDETVERELSRSRRNRKPMSVIVLDVDHFKRFNDTKGHRAGDEALQGLGDLLLHAVRAEDVVCRFGGEEVVVVMPDCSRERCAERAELLRGLVEQSGLGLTISVGVAESLRDGPTWDAMFRAADARLYRAKEAGRNCVVASELAQGPVPSSLPVAASSPSSSPSSG